MQLTIIVLLFISSHTFQVQESEASLLSAAGTGEEAGRRVVVVGLQFNLIMDIIEFVEEVQVGECTPSSPLELVQLLEMVVLERSSNDLIS